MGFFKTDAGRGAIGAGIGSGISLLTGLIGSNQDKQNLKAQANIVAQQNKAAIEVERLRLEQAKLMAQGATSKPMNTTILYGALGLGGVLILGLVVYMVTKK